MNQAFIKQDEAVLLESELKEVQGNCRISTAPGIPLLFLYSPSRTVISLFKGVGFTAAAQLILNLLENISTDNRVCYSVTDT